MAVMDGARETFTCPACGRRFTYWVLQGNLHPKVACFYCKKEFFPQGEPPAAKVEPAKEAPGVPAKEPAKAASKEPAKEAKEPA